ncbi:MAG TPA: DUF4249 family protein [Ignavibacteriaceae bacterium]|nr:DUF4249 family protein [Ignavibacteriaceae bacterium]
MKKTLSVLQLILFLFFESCSDDFNINAPYQDIYVLNCILRNDNSIQYAIFSKNSFTENGIPPSSTSAAQNIKEANLKIFYNDSVFVMRDTTIELTDSENSRVNCFYLKNLILSPWKVISIEASVPGGKILKSTIQVPKISFADFSRKFPQVTELGDYQERPFYSWSWVGNAQESTAILDIPQLEVYYKHYEQGIYVDKKVLVPLAFYFIIDQFGNLSPVNVEISFNTFCVTKLETVDKTLRDLSGNDPHKEDYTITKVVFSVISMDSELSKYYSAYETYSENFTIKLRQTDFSNIEGGKGIFGIYYKFSLPLVIDSRYIESFGYRYDPL